MKRFIVLFTSIVVVLMSIVLFIGMKLKTPTIELTKEEKNYYFDYVPKDPYIFTSQKVYKDSKLRHSVKEVKAYSKLGIKEIKQDRKYGIPYFILDDGTYIQASKEDIYSAKVSKIEDYKKEKYTKKDVVSYAIPFEADNLKDKEFTADVKINVNKKIKVNNVDFVAFTNEKNMESWIKLSDLSDDISKMGKVQNLLNKKYNNKNYSIYVEDINSQASAGINENMNMYSASLTKLPIMYWTQKEIDGGLSPDTKYKYTKAVNLTNISFSPEGTGIMPKDVDNKEYKLSELLTNSGKYSDNVASNILGYYVCGNASKEYQEDIDKVSGSNWDMLERDASSKMAAKFMIELYKMKGIAYESLTDTEFDNQRIPKNLPDSIVVAHKVGEADEFHHDAGVVEVKNPYVISIETKGDTDLDIISDISKDVYDILK